jgi:hypothetical protein
MYTVLKYGDASKLTYALVDGKLLVLAGVKVPPSIHALVEIDENEHKFNDYDTGADSTRASRIGSQLAGSSIILARVNPGKYHVGKKKSVVLVNVNGYYTDDHGRFSGPSIVERMLAVKDWFVSLDWDDFEPDSYWLAYFYYSLKSSTGEASLRVIEDEDFCEEARARIIHVHSPF